MEVKKCWWGAIAAILMIIVGSLLFMHPIVAAMGSAMLLCLGIAVGGGYYLSRYFGAQPKNKWDLVLGIINIIFTGWILQLWFSSESMKTIASMIMFIAMYMAFMLFATGFAKFKMVSAMKSEGNTSTGLITFSAWMNMLAAVFFIFSPFVMTIVFEQMGGIYLVISGVILLVESGVCAFKKES